MKLSRLIINTHGYVQKKNRDDHSTRTCVTVDRLENRCFAPSGPPTPPTGPPTPLSMLDVFTGRQASYPTLRGGRRGGGRGRAALVIDQMFIVKSIWQKFMTRIV